MTRFTILIERHLAAHGDDAVSVVVVEVPRERLVAHVEARVSTGELACGFGKGEARLREPNESPVLGHHQLSWITTGSSRRTLTCEPTESRTSLPLVPSTTPVPPVPPTPAPIAAPFLPPMIPPTIAPTPAAPPMTAASFFFPLSASCAT